MKDIKEKLLKNMGYLIVVLDILMYFTLSYLFVDTLQTNILTIIINGALLFVGAVIANSALMKQGILNGRDTERYKETLTAHINEKKAIYPKIKHLQPWLDKDYLKLLRMGRTVYVNSAGFDYEQVFTAEGKVKDDLRVPKPKAVEYKGTWQKITSPIRKMARWIWSEEWKIYRQKKYFLKKAKQYKITRQTISYLLNIDEEKDPNDFGITEQTYTKRKSCADTITRLVFSILLQTITFGFYGFNLSTFIVQLLNIILIVLSALYSMYSAFYFMVKTHRETIIKKINKLEEFDHADLKEFEEKEKENVKIQTESTLPPKSDMVEETHREIEPGKTSNIQSN